MRNLSVSLAGLFLASGLLAQSPTWVQVQPTNKPSARWEHAMAYDSIFGRTVLFGGRPSNNAYLNDTWEYDGQNWTQLSPTTSPPGRYLSEMIYNPKKLQGFLFAGRGPSGDTNDTWVWDSIKKDWTQMNPANSPPARYNPALAYDSARDVIVMFGGSGNKSDTWEWNGSNWIQINPTTSPPGRYTAMAYDSARKVCVIYGGSNNAGDTWEYNGTTWTQVMTTKRPSAYCCVALEYDPVRQRIVAFGGYSPNNGETWEFDGKDWTKINPTTSPPPRRDFDNMVYDIRRQRMVLFGGYGTGPHMDDTWEYLATAPLTASPATISVATGGSQKWTLDAGSQHGSRLYWIFGSVTGTSPGVTLASLAGSVTIPLNPDPYTDLSIAFANSAFLSNTRAALNGSGQAQAAINVPQLTATAVGLKLYHAFLVYDASNNFYMASNPVTLELVR